MLAGFEDITENLSEYELKTLVPVFLKGFQWKIGQQNVVTNKQIVERLKPKGYKINAVTVRKVINYIRTHDLAPGLIASSDGYYITNNPIELKRYIDSLMGRENEIRRVREHIEKFLNVVESNQLAIVYPMFGVKNKTKEL